MVRVLETQTKQQIWEIRVRVTGIGLGLGGARPSVPLIQFQSQFLISRSSRALESIREEDKKGWQLTTQKVWPFRFVHNSVR